MRRVSIQERRRRMASQVAAHRETLGALLLLAGVALAGDAITAVFIHTALPFVPLLAAFGVCLLATGLYGALLEMAYLADRKRTQRKGDDEE